MNPFVNDPVAYYKKRLMLLRTILQTLGWNDALRCLEFALRHHVGFRKDGKTPEFLHQVEQALYALTLRTLLKHPQETISAILLHDTLEDYYDHGVRYEDILGVAGPIAARAVERLTNHVNGIAKPDALYYDQMAEDVVAAFAKACDCMNNQGTMPEVYTKEKIRLKIDKALTLVFPMLKNARKRFPEQFEAFQNVKTVLEQQVRLLEHVTGV